MNQAQILLSIIEQAKIGSRIDPEEALSTVASLINKLDKVSDSYEKDMADLLSIGACIWQLKSI